MKDFDSRSREYREYIESYLENRYSHFGNEPQKPLFDAMKYSLLAGGKRLRPIFAFEFCRLCGAPWQNAAPFAAANTTDVPPTAYNTSTSPDANA